MEQSALVPRFGTKAVLGWWWKFEEERDFVVDVGEVLEGGDKSKLGFCMPTLA